MLVEKMKETMLMSLGLEIDDNCLLIKARTGEKVKFNVSDFNILAKDITEICEKEYRQRISRNEISKVVWGICQYWCRETSPGLIKQEWKDETEKAINKICCITLSRTEISTKENIVEVLRERSSEIYNDLELGDSPDETFESIADEILKEEL